MASDGPDHRSKLADHVQALILSALGSLAIAVFVQEPSLLVKAPLRVALVPLVALIVYGLMALGQRRLFPQGRSVVPLMATAVVTLSLAFALRAPAPTVYFVLDATQNAAEILDRVVAEFEFAVALLPTHTRLGLRTFGGTAEVAADGCGATRQLVAPVPFTKGIELIHGSLGSLQAEGHASLALALFSAIEQDLASVVGSKKVVAIFSEPDRECDRGEDAILRSLGNTIADDTQLMLISLGKLDPEQCSALDGYARVLNGRHFNLPDLRLLPELVRPFSSYGLGYFRPPKSGASCT